MMSKDTAEELMLGEMRSHPGEIYGSSFRPLSADSFYVFVGNSENKSSLK